MFGIGYFKAQPTEFVQKVAGGRIKREGQALSFYYLKRRTSVVVVPVSSADAAFVFNEQTGNYQAVTIQGQLTYRIIEPRRTVEMLNYVIDPQTRMHVSQDPERLKQRIIVTVQMETRRQVEGRPLEGVLGNAASISAEVQEEVRSRDLLAPLGVELLSLNFTSVSPNPEVGKALEAEYRESLLRRADEAIYARRAAAVEEEGKIKSNELEGEISLARERERLIDLEAANDRKKSQAWGERRELEAGFTARASEMELAPYRDFDPRKLLALAMRDIGNNAGKVGNLNITSDLLADLLQTRTNADN
ncbi:MAG TPA: SPFH domain-containing protein [Rubrobacteraceae bacterium]|jgi:regulator of protease activity HflC (stomatin/prohibitin superfamily)|nr:SPFH domain-containing protein [Rubrobacteraceae bacterium]